MKTGSNATGRSTFYDVLAGDADLASQASLWSHEGCACWKGYSFMARSVLRSTGLKP